MINVKDQVYEALCKVTENVTSSYPADWENLPAIQYTEEQNSVEIWTDNEEQAAYCRYRIDIWNNTSTSQLALAVDQQIAELGLKRIQCSDVDDTEKDHKIMRYEMVIDVKHQIVYHK